MKPVSNDHLYNEIYYLWFIQWCILMMTEGTHLLVFNNFCILELTKVALGHLDELPKAEMYPFAWSL